MSRVLILSNRLPVTIQIEDGTPSLAASAGGLATGLTSLYEKGEVRWIGWPGADLGPLEADVRDRLLDQLRERGLVPVLLDSEEVKRFYEGFSNAVLWPIFHYQPYALPLEVRDFDAYEAVNERFADAVAAEWQPGDLVWVHDYQLLLAPALIRRRIPDARIGFFLHIPFPSFEVFRALPHRERLLEGMLGADLIGFHTAAYLRHFATAVLRILGAGPRVDRIPWRSTEVKLGVFPMGIDAAAFGAIADSSAVLEEVRTIRGEDGTKVLLGVDRLDYTKGIPRRLLAFERLLERHPDLRERVRLVQIAVPSRQDVEAYQSFRSQTEELIGRIHGAFATARWVPVHWIYRSLSRTEVIALYRAADVMIVTPLRDGMNLVAKEFVASRVDEGGVLVLSEFAGAAAEMAEALQVNPFDIESTAEAIHRALSMPEDERRRRMRALRRRVTDFDVHRWASRFLHSLSEATPEAMTEAASALLARELEGRLVELRAAAHLTLLLDYDGTLVPFTLDPTEAAPDPDLLDLLGALAARPGWEVHVVSGRSPGSLDRWLGHLPIALHAEHGFFSRACGVGEWESVGAPNDGWRKPVRAILADFADRTPGAFVEEKTACVAWHYRAADPEFGALQAKELYQHLSEMLSNLPVEILPGDSVIEVRPHGVHKGSIVAPLVAAAPPGTRFLALGDDRTDEDLFAALPVSGIAVHVGRSRSSAPYRVESVREARSLLRRLLADPAG